MKPLLLQLSRSTQSSGFLRRSDTQSRTPGTSDVETVEGRLWQVAGVHCFVNLQNWSRNIIKTNIKQDFRKKFAEQLRKAERYSVFYLCLVWSQIVVTKFAVATLSLSVWLITTLSSRFLILSFVFWGFYNVYYTWVVLKIRRSLLLLSSGRLNLILVDHEWNSHQMCGKT